MSVLIWVSDMSPSSDSPFSELEELLVLEELLLSSSDSSLLELSALLLVSESIGMFLPSWRAQMHGFLKFTSERWVNQSCCYSTTDKSILWYSLQRRNATILQCKQYTHFAKFRLARRSEPDNPQAVLGGAQKYCKVSQTKKFYPLHNTKQSHTQLSNYGAHSYSRPSYSNLYT